MTLEEYNIRIGNVIKDLEGGVHAQIMTEMALDAIALIRLRVAGTGRDSEGQFYKDYTARYKRFKSGKVKHRPTTKFQNKNTGNKYRGFVDFSFSTRMWNNMKLVSSNTDLQKGIAKIKCTTTFEQEKLNWNTKQRGPILALSNGERDMFLDIYDEKILKIWRKNGL
jgi:hypothetical protein